MTFLQLALPAIAIAFLFVSIFSSFSTANRHHRTDDARVANHLVAMTCALWAIAILLLWIGLR